MPDISNGKHVQALKLAESSHVHSPLVAGGIYGNLGAAHMFMADYEAAAGLLEPARAIAHDNQDRVSLSKALANLGTVYQVFSAATLLKVQQFQLALSLSFGCRRVADVDSLCRLRSDLNSFAFIPIEQVMGEYQQALDVLRQEAALAREMKDWRAEARTYDSVGSICLLLGQLPQAVTYFEHELACAQQAGYDRAKMRASAQLGLTCLMMSRMKSAPHPTESLQKACKWFEHQIYYCQKIADFAAMASGYYNLGTCWLEFCIKRDSSKSEEGDVDARVDQQALARSRIMFHQAIDTAEKRSQLNLQHLAIASKRELAKCLLLEGQKIEAIKLLEQHLSLTISVGRSLCLSCGQVCGEDDVMFNCQHCRVAIAGSCCSRVPAKKQIISEAHEYMCPLLTRWNEVLRGKEKPEACRLGMMDFLQKFVPIWQQNADTTDNPSMHSQQQHNPGQGDEKAQCQSVSTPSRKSLEVPQQQGQLEKEVTPSLLHSPNSIKALTGLLALP